MLAREGSSGLSWSDHFATFSDALAWWHSASVETLEERYGRRRWRVSDDQVDGLRVSIGSAASGFTKGSVLFGVTFERAPWPVPHWSVVRLASCFEKGHRPIQVWKAWVNSWSGEHVNANSASGTHTR